MREAGDLTLDSAAGTITRTQGSWLADGFKVGQSITIGVEGDGESNNAGDYRIAEVTASVLTLEEVLQEDETRGDLTVTGARSVSLFETTGLSGRLNASASDINFRAAVGPLGLFVSEGTVAIGGDVPPLKAGDPEDLFRVGLDFEDDAAGRKLLRAVDLGEDFSAQLAGSRITSYNVCYTKLLRFAFE